MEGLSSASENLRGILHVFGQCNQPRAGLAEGLYTYLLDPLMQVPNSLQGLSMYVRTPAVFNTFGGI